MRVVRDVGIGVISTLIVNALVLFWASVLKPSMAQLHPGDLLQRAISEWHLWGVLLFSAAQVLTVALGVHAIIDGILEYRDAKRPRLWQENGTHSGKELRDSILIGLGWMFVAALFMVGAIFALSP